MTLELPEDEQVMDAEAELKSQAQQRPTRTRAEAVPIAPGMSIVRPETGGGEMAEYRDLSREILPEDIRLPRFQIAQSMSKPVQERTMDTGIWYSTLGNMELGKQIKVVALDIYKSRSYFIQGAGLSCSSANMTLGIGDPGGDCESCVLKDWPPRGTRGGPKCRVNYHFPCVLIPDDYDPSLPPMLGLVRMTGTSAPAGQDMLGMWQQSGKLWHEISFILRIGTKPFGQSFYHIATAAWGGKPPEEMTQTLSELSLHVKSSTVIDAGEEDED